MLQPDSNARSKSLALVLGLAVFWLASSATAVPCEVPDNGVGTANLPPAGCEYSGETVADFYELTAGLPPGTTIEMVPVLKNFFCGLPIGTCSAPLPPGICEVAGGNLGGNVTCTQPSVELTITGTGMLAGFSRFITVPLDWETHSGPRNLGDPVQSFSTDVFRMQGQIFGDPDFCVFNLRAGSQLGFPSPGSTVLTELPSGNWNVDSFFDVAYDFEFQGCPGSQLEGFAGSTQSSLRIRTGETLASASVPALSPLSAAALGALLLLLVGTVPMIRRRAEHG